MTGMTHSNSHDLTPGSRVVIAMSGGVDSSVAAALMQEAGFDVVGITLQLYDHGAAVQRKGACCAGQDIHDARAVADALGFPHYVLDYESRFKQSVIDEFADGYLAGRTPIPCVRCNQTVKFTDLLATARELDAQALVTGHYIQRKLVDGRAELHRAVDAEKDQSYFLFATTQAQADFCRFPLGGLSKTETRAHAERLALPVAAKPESQDICFVPDGDYAGIVGRLRPGSMMPGTIRHVDGRVLGTHKGIVNYTIGQRRGLGIADAERLYVVSINPAEHEVIVGPREACLATGALLADSNWLIDDPATFQGEVDLKIGHNEHRILGRLEKTEHGIIAHFDEPAFAVAKGQACVAYLGSRLLGGGWIETAIQGPVDGNDQVVQSMTEQRSHSLTASTTLP